MPRRRLKVTDVNPHFMCTICDGYLVDATTIIECLHSFCRTCIVRYLESSKFCPVCDVQVHKTRPLLSIRSDQTLQDLVYKMVPGLYQNEMQKRREFYAEHPEAASECPPEERGECDPRFFSPNESLSIIVQHRPKDPPDSGETADEKDPTTRFLSCPAAFTMGHLKKFIHFKFSLPPACAIDVFYDDHLLRDDDTLMDVAYIYSWKRAAPMKFQYAISKRIPKCIDPPPPPASVVVPLSAPPVEAMDIVEATAVDPPLDEVTAPMDEAAAEAPEPQAMEIDQEPEIQPKPEIIEDVKPSVVPEAAKSELPESVPVPSSTNCVQQIDVVVEPEVVNKPSSPEKPVSKPIAEPTYNSVKLVSPPGRNPVLSPTNGIRLKFTHDPGKSEPRSRSKKSGRKGGRNSRHKSGGPVRLARLAPYPPPSVAVTCLTTQPHQRLSQITVGKLVPSVVPSVIAPTIVTTLVSTTATTFCSATQNSDTPQVSRGGSTSNHPTAVGNICSNANNFVSSVPSSGLENNRLSSTSESSQLVNGLIVTSASSQSTDQSSLTNTKELSKTLTSACAIISTPSISQNLVASPGPSETLSMRSDSPKMDATSSISITAVCIPMITNGVSNSDSTLSVSCIPDKLSTVTPSIPPVSSASKDSDSTEKPATIPVEDPPVKVVPSSDESNSSAFKEQVPSEPDKVTTVDSINNNLSSVKVKETLLKNLMDEKSESFKMSVKNSISAEFSDNDDLGCQPDLIVDEQKVDSSDNEDDTDAALRKKITAIAEKDDEADVTDDTEADSGRASDMSCPARCEDDVGSPMLTDVSTPVAAAPVPAAAPPPPPPQPTIDNHRHIKSNNIDAVIDNLYRQHEIGRPPSSTVSPKPVPSPQPPVPPKDDNGVLDLSTCTRKQSDGQVSRPKAVANPVLDIKHRQQPYLPAPQQHTTQHPMKQHTVCPPAPKHPTSSYLMQQHLLQHQAAAHTNSILHAQLTGNSKSHSLSYSPSTSTAQFSASSRSVSSPSTLPGRTTPAVYGHKLPPGSAHPAGINLASMLPYPHSMMSNLASYASRGNLPMNLPLPNRSFANCLPKEASMATSSTSSKQTFSHAKDALTFSARKPHDVGLPGSPSCRASSVPSPSAIPAHPRTSPSMMRLSPHHRSASPAPSPQHVTPANSLAASSLAAATTPSHCKPSVPMYKKMDSSKSFNNKFKGSSNVVVYNKDPSRCSLVFKNLNSRQNNRH